jgi:hypothetical protein
MTRLSPRSRRRLEGCYYMGCFTPIAFAALAVYIGIKALADWVRPPEAQA